MSKISFLTSNSKKAADFGSFGFGVKEFTREILEVRSNLVEEVALHKARDTGLSNIVVEDTALFVEGAHFLGTEIKHVYDEIKDNACYHGHHALWKVALCMNRDGKFYIATGELHGSLQYPALDKGYHFERLFAVEVNGKPVHFENLADEQKVSLSPRFQALNKMKQALQSNDFSQLIVIQQDDVPQWSGEYQEEKQPVAKSRPKNGM